MFKPSYMSAKGPTAPQGPHSYYGDEAATSTDSEKSKNLVDELYAKCDKYTGLKYAGCMGAVKLASVAGEAALQKVGCEWFNQCDKTTDKSTTSRLSSNDTTSLQNTFRSQMTADEYALWESNVKTKYGKMPLPLQKGWTAQKTIDWFNKAKAEGELILAKRTQFTKSPASLTPTSLSKQSEKDYTWYYVGGAVGVLAAATAVWYFGFKK